MRRIFLCVLVLCYSLLTLAQRNKAEPLVIQGKIANTTEKILKIFFEDESGKLIIDTIKINTDGTFFLKTNHIKKPQRTSLQQNSLQINRVYVAPGYNLTITGDASNYTTLLKKRRISGIGAETNAYRQKVDSIYAARNSNTAWYDLQLEDLLKFINSTKRLNDSVFKVVFNKQPRQDKYFDTFKKMISVDEQSMAYYMLLQHLEMNKFSYQQMADISNRNIPPIFKNGISNDEYLISEDYKAWILPLYIAFNRKMDILRDSNSVKRPDYLLKSINNLYKGKVRDRYLYFAITAGIRRASSIEQLNLAKKETDKLYNALNDAALKREIANSYAEKENQLMLVQTGKPAPAFTVPSDKGRPYSLADFKDKVVYIDLWASWCVPCRAEMPNYRKLYEKYERNDKIAFVAIAVFDGEREWRKALEVDKPAWLQLYDSKGIVARSYVANAIPKYIIIDKNGKVANFNAPGPGTAEIQRLLDAEIAK